MTLLPQPSPATRHAAGDVMAATMAHYLFRIDAILLLIISPSRRGITRATMNFKTFSPAYQLPGRRGMTLFRDVFTTYNIFARWHASSATRLYALIIAFLDGAQATRYSHTIFHFT